MSTTVTGPEPQNHSVEAELEELQLEEKILDRRTIGLQNGQIAIAVGTVIAVLISVGALTVALTNKSDNVTVQAAQPTASAKQTPTPAVAPARHIGVSLKEFTVNPTAKQAKAGRVTFSVRNDGSVLHEFVVLRTDAAAGQLPVTSAKADETGNVGETGDLKPGRAKTIALNLKPGHYLMICNLPGHYTAGQRTDLTVK
jgi:uncharacterized cupredoxin-like copper-binding protein